MLEIVAAVLERLNAKLLLAVSRFAVIVSVIAKFVGPVMLLELTEICCTPVSTQATLSRDARKIVYRMYIIQRYNINATWDLHNTTLYQRNLDWL